MTFWEWLFATSAAMFVFIMYTWFVIDVAATTAIKRINESLESDDDDDVADELDNMWRR